MEDSNCQPCLCPAIKQSNPTATQVLDARLLGNQYMVMIVQHIQSDPSLSTLLAQAAAAALCKAGSQR